MNAIIKAVQETEARLTELATIGYMTLKSAKEISYSSDTDDEPDSTWAPQLMYERARGIIDTVQDIGYLFLGTKATDDILDTARKAVGYKASTENEYSVHAAACLATHTPSKPTYTYSGSQDSSSSKGGTIVHSSSGSRIKAWEQQANNGNTRLWDDDPAPFGGPSTPSGSEADFVFWSEADALRESAEYWADMGQTDWALSMANELAAAQGYGPFTRDQLRSAYTKHMHSIP